MLTKVFFSVILDKLGLDKTINLVLSLNKQNLVLLL